MTHQVNDFKPQIRPIYWTLLILLAVPLLSSCDGKEDSTPTLQIEEYFEIPYLYGLELFKVEGSGHYTIFVGDTDIIHAKYKDRQVLVEAAQKGITGLTMINQATKKKATTTIKVVDTYFAYRLDNATYPFTADDEYVFFVKKDSTNFFTYNKSLDKITNKGKYKIQNQGPGSSYLLSIHLENARESLNDFNFSISGIPNELLHLLINDEELQAQATLNYPLQDMQTRSNQPQYLELINKETEEKQILWMDFVTFPYHIL